MGAPLPPEEDKPGVPLAPPLLFVFPIAAFAGLELVLPTHLIDAPWRWIVGATLLLAGVGLNIGGAIVQRRAGTDFLPERPTTRIVQHGPYAYSRNPMYVGFALWTASLAFLADSAWLLLAVPVGLVLIDRVIIAREERYLERKFGDEYRDYKRKVRRWL